MAKAKPKVPRRVHTAEFKADTARLFRKGVRIVAQVASNFGLGDNLVHP